MKFKVGDVIKGNEEANEELIARVIATGSFQYPHDVVKDRDIQIEVIQDIPTNPKRSNDNPWVTSKYFDLFDSTIYEAEAMFIKMKQEVEAENGNTES